MVKNCLYTIWLCDNPIQNIYITPLLCDDFRERDSSDLQIDDGQMDDRVFAATL